MKKRVFLMFLFFLGTFLLINIGNVNAASVTYLLDGAADCQDIIDAEVWDFIQQVFNVIKYAGPLLCLVLSISDFIKATASQDKDALVKAAKTTGKRVVYALILFFIPTLINFLFPLLGWVGTCGIG